MLQCKAHKKEMLAGGSFLFQPSSTLYAQKQVDLLGMMLSMTTVLERPRDLQACLKASAVC